MLEGLCCYFPYGVLVQVEEEAIDGLFVQQRENERHTRDRDCCYLTEQPAG